MIKFIVFADFHYRKEMYASRVVHLEKILDAAYIENVDFVVHVGDLCNDYFRSPELLYAYLSNKYNLSVFGVYGNHELEAECNTMEYISKRLSNRDIIFASDKDGYWHYDIGMYRILGLDTNYSYDRKNNLWEHNKTRSHGAPSGNEFENSLSPKQIEWLEIRLSEAQKENKKVIIFSHVGFCPWWEKTPDADQVACLFNKYQSSIILAVSGHIHSDDFKVWDNIPYFNVNAAINGCWLEQDEDHYSERHKYVYDEYDEEGNLISSQDRSINNLTQAKNTWFFDDPLYAVVTVNNDGEIYIKGKKTKWMHGVAPSKIYYGCKPEIENRRYKK